MSKVVLDCTNGMPEDCALSLDNVTVAPKALSRERIVRLPVEGMSEVGRALSLPSGCA